MKKSETERTVSKQGIRKLKKNFFLENATFRISKINLNTLIQTKVSNNVKASIVSDTMLNPKMSQKPTKSNKDSEHLQRSVSMNYRMKQPIYSMELNNYQNISPVKESHKKTEEGFVFMNPNRIMEGFEGDLKQFKIEASKISKKEYGPIKAYAVNTHSGLFHHQNQDRLSIITNLTSIEHKNNNQTMVSFFGVYDGHNGAGCSEYLRDYLHLYIAKDTFFHDNIMLAIKNGFRRVEDEFLKEAQKRGDNSGSSALVVIIKGNKCYVANVGDSRAIMSVDYGKSVIQLSNDHNPSSESEYRRVIKAGGSIYHNKTSSNKYNQRVIPGRLEVTRSIGDCEVKNNRYGMNSTNIQTGFLQLKAGVIISDPDIKEYDLSGSDFIFMASDGIFDFLTNEEVAKCIWTNALLRKKNDIHEQSGDLVCSVMVKALKRVTTDCLSCLLICFENLERTLFQEDQIELPGMDYTSQASQQPQ